MHRNKYWQSKIPVRLVLLYAANLILVILLEILLVYPLSKPLTEANFASIDSCFKNCTIITTDETNGLTVYLIETADGQQHIIPTRQHSIAYNRCRIYDKQIQSVPEADGSHTVTVRIGLRNIPITVIREQWQVSEDEYTTIETVSIDSYTSSSYRSTGTLYMVIAAVLEFIELAIWQLLKGHL